jgi:hypothetical protein
MGHYVGKWDIGNYHKWKKSMEMNGKCPLR